MSETTDNPLQFNPSLVRAIALGSEEIIVGFRRVEEAANKFHTRYYASTYGIPRPEKIERDGGNPVDVIQAELALFHLLQGRRIAEHMGDFVVSFSQRRLLACTLALRGVLEVTAAVAYHRSKIRKLLADGELSVDAIESLVKCLDTALRGGRFDWERWTSEGTSREDLRQAYDDSRRRGAKKPSPEIEQSNISTIVGHLAKEVADWAQCGKEDVDLWYALLSDICHPSFGSNLLAQLSRPAEDQSVIGPRASVDLMRWYWVEVVSPVVVPLLSYAEERLDELDEIAGGFSWAPEGS